MDELKIGDTVRAGASARLWPEDEVRLDWQPSRRVTLNDAADRAGVSIDTVLRYRDGKRVQRAAEVSSAVAEYETSTATLSFMQNKRRDVQIPRVLDESLASLLGYLVGDGHISQVKRVIGLTTGDEEQAERFAALAFELFGVKPTKKLDGGRWRILFSSQTIQDFPGCIWD